MKQIKYRIPALMLVLVLILTACQQAPPSQTSFSLEDVPEFSGEPYVVLQDNQPDFSQEDLVQEAFESYSPLDLLGRCGAAYACVGLETMPVEERGAIGQVKPSGWHLAKYNCVDGKYLYNRCHLIGYQLTGENANEQNLITGTRYLNVEGMLPFENMVADYVEQTGGHVLYRVTPIFQGSELVARGVQMEAESVEDEGAGVCFNVYVYNVQPGVAIDYATGESWLAQDQRPEADQPDGGGEAPGNEPGEKENAQPQGNAGGEDKEPSEQDGEGEGSYVVNVKSGRFHLPDCAGVSTMKEENKQYYTGSRQELIGQGYVPCGQCRP